MSWRNEVMSSARRGARLFRVGLEAQGSEAIVAIVGALEGVPPEDLGALEAVFGEIAAAQRRRDLLRLADLLEYDLPPALVAVAS